MGNWNALADRSLSDGELTTEEALSVLRAPDGELLALLDAAWQRDRKSVV